MSIRLTTAQAAYHVAAPNGGGSFTAVLWVRRESDTGGPEGAFARNHDNWQQADSFGAHGAFGDVFNHYHAATTSGSVGSATIGTWFGFMLRYVGETTPGSSADGVSTLHRMNDGDLSEAGAFTQVSTMSGLSNLSPTQIIIGANRQNLESSGDWTIAMCKVFPFDLTTTQAITELRYRNPQISSWGAYPFADGNLLNDVSGNGRHLIGIGTPTFSADEPIGIEGDGPGGGTTENVAADIVTPTDLSATVTVKQKYQVSSLMSSSTALRGDQDTIVYALTQLVSGTDLSGTATVILRITQQVFAALVSPTSFEGTVLVRQVTQVASSITSATSMGGTVRQTVQVSSSMPSATVLRASAFVPVTISIFSTIRSTTAFRASLDSDTDFSRILQHRPLSSSALRHRPLSWRSL